MGWVRGADVHTGFSPRCGKRIYLHTSSPHPARWRTQRCLLERRPAGWLADAPVQLVCPACRQTVLTKVAYTSGLLTYLFCGGLFFCGFVLGCCLIPFCVDRLKDAQHTCPICKAELGVYKRL